MKLTAVLTKEELSMAISAYVGLAIYDGSFDPDVVVQSVDIATGATVIVIVGDFAKGGDTDSE